MPSLSDKLKSLGVKVGAEGLPAPIKHRGHPIEQVVSGRVHTTHSGDAYVVEVVYPSDHLYGHTPLNVPASLSTVAHWAGGGKPELIERIQRCSTHGFAYLDIETTGLMGGTGTYAFLIGVGRFDEDGFHLAQFFMRDPLEEPAQLLALEQFVAPCETLVTYNGKSFDVPLLNTRYLTHGWRSPLFEPAHVDLLHLSRRIWRERLPSRTLGNVETFILGAHRTEEDVPGWQIPQLYFDYLRSGDARPLKSVFYHNAMDVLAMAALLNHVTVLLEDPLESQSPENVLDLVGVGRLYEELGRTDDACRIYGRCLQESLPDDLLLDTLQRLSLIYKRNGDYLTALPLWEKAASYKHLYAFEELAKYYEHHARDVQTAIYWTKAALELIHSPAIPKDTRQEYQPKLEHRMQRLQRKSGSSG